MRSSNAEQSTLRKRGNGSDSVVQAASCGAVHGDPQVVVTVQAGSGNAQLGVRNQSEPQGNRARLAGMP